MVRIEPDGFGRSDVVRLLKLSYQKEGVAKGVHLALPWDGPLGSQPPRCEEASSRSVDM